MPATNFPEYAKSLEDVLNSVVSSGEAININIQIDQRSSLRGFIVGILQFSDDSELHFREFVDISLTEPRLMYAYHFQDADKLLVFRYDNAPHRPALPQAAHKHTPNKVKTSSAPILAQVIDEILQIIHPRG